MRALKSFIVASILLTLCAGCQKKKPVPVTVTVKTPPLHEAAEARDIARVQALIAGGADVNATDAYGDTALFVALDSDNLDVVRILLAHGATPRTVNARGDTPLDRAIGLGDPNLVKELIAHGADVNAKAGPESELPLHAAALCGREEIVEILLAAGAQINAVDMWGRTALHRVLRGWDFDLNMARFLLAKGADAKTKTYDGETPLHVTARLGDDDIVARLIAGGADVNAVDRPGDTPVLYAARCGHLDIVKRLVAAGAAVNVANKPGETPLTEAVRYGEPDLVKFLISKGADVNVRYRKNRYTPLHLAACYGWKPVAELLIAAGAQVDAGDAIGTDDRWAEERGWGRPGSSRAPKEPGQTPVQVAMRAGYWKIVRLLAEHGARITIHQAACLGQLEKVKQLLAEGAEVDALDPQGWTALRWAAQEGHVDVVQLLLAHGADINGKSDGGVPLIEAMERRHSDVAAVLIMNGAKLNVASDRYAKTLLEMAASSGRRDLAELLISKGAAAETDRGPISQAMISAAEAGRKDMVEFFFARGADVNAKGGTGWTALHCAAEFGHADIAQLLIARGADVKAVTDRGETAVDLAMEWGHREIVRLLAAVGADLTIHAAAYIGDSNAVQRLVARGADVNAMDEHQRTPLCLAAREGNMAVAELLIGRGAKINRGKEAGSWLPSPLYAAVERGQTDMVKLLIRHGADIRTRTLEGYTPLHEATRYGHREIAELLIDKGVEVNARADWDNTALREAALQAHADVIELLLARGAEIVAGKDDTGIVLPAPQGRPAAETARLLIEAYAPYTTIVTDSHEVRSFLRGYCIPFDDVWTPGREDIQGLDSGVRIALEANSSVIASSWLDRDFVLRNFHRYNREYAGFIDDGVKYVVCHMVQSDGFYRPPPNPGFTPVADGGSSVVGVIFKAADKTVVKIECNGEA